MPAWPARWISFDPDPRREIGVFAFRRRLKLSKVPKRVEVRVSADQRYKLFVGEVPVAFGPQRGDPLHWPYETVDLAAFLKPGENVVWALVWNFGRLAPMAQHTVRLGFVLDGEGFATGKDWEVAPVEAWDFAMMHSDPEPFYIDVGPGEIVDGRRMRDDRLLGLDESLPWRVPHDVSHAEERGALSGGTPWNLVPRTIPPMLYRLRETPPDVRDPARDAPLAPGREIDGKLLLDYRELLCAYPRLTVSGPAGTKVRLTYAESLWTPEGGKGNRDEVEGKAMRGYQDRLILGDGPLTFEPLWWRTYRYLQIEADAPVRLHRIDAIETGYPYEIESSFEADDPWVRPIWDVSARTARRCAGETYFDCPYYEQLQYAGDTRIQALLHYYLSTDRALARNAVETLGWSLMENGLTQSRYPSRQPQVIPPFSLWWVMMLQDQMLYDEGADRHRWSAVASTLLDQWWAVSERNEFWNFADWVPGWRWGVPPLGGRSPIHSLTYTMAILADARADYHDGPDWYWDDRAKYIETFHPRDGILCMDGRDPEPSEHAEALFRICQGLANREPDPWPANALDAAGAARCTYYFSYYKHLAMFGREDSPYDYVEELGPWKEMIEQGLTTFAENPEPTRSDCHAWSAHPILGFFQIVAGVTSVAPGWTKARIAPRPGRLRRFDARIAHPRGQLRVAYEDGRLEIDSPVPAELVWRGEQASLEPGRTSVGR
jgi:alpha-L-rhamnosidase